MKFFSVVWNLIPALARMWVVLAGVVLVLVASGFTVYKIDQKGFDRCQTRYEAASVELKDKSRKEILKSGKQYEKIKTEIDTFKGVDAGVGSRVQLAIDRMPGSSERE